MYVKEKRYIHERLNTSLVVEDNHECRLERFNRIFDENGEISFKLYT